MCQVQKDRDEQTGCEFKRVLSMNVRMYLPCRVRLVSGAMTSCNLSFAMFISDLDPSQIIMQNVSIWIGIRIGETSNPGPRLRRRRPRRNRGETSFDEASGILDGQQTCDEKDLLVLHINLRGYVPNIAESTALLGKWPTNQNW